MSDKVFKINNLEIPVIKEDIEEDIIVACMPLTSPLIQPDNLSGSCADCSDEIQWHPSSPKRGIKVCVRCAMISAKSNGENFSITEEQEEYLKNFIESTKNKVKN